MVCKMKNWFLLIISSSNLSILTFQIVTLTLILTLVVSAGKSAPKLTSDLYQTLLKSKCLVKNNQQHICHQIQQPLCRLEIVKSEELVVKRECKNVVDIVCSDPSEIEDHQDQSQRSIGPQLEFYGPYILVDLKAQRGCREVNVEKCIERPVLRLVSLPVEHCQLVPRLTCSASSQPAVCQPNLGSYSREFSDYFIYN